MYALTALRLDCTRGEVDALFVEMGARDDSATLAFTRYCFTSKTLMWKSIILSLPRPICKAYPIAILLHDHCAIYAPPPTPPFYVIHHTISVI